MEANELFSYQYTLDNGRFGQGTVETALKNRRCDIKVFDMRTYLVNRSMNLDTFFQFI